jgi:hypothetical protein
MNSGVESRRGAVARILVWSGILAATGAFWITVVFGLAAWLR